MTKSRNFWLATAAVMVAGGGAQAADLPFRKAAPVEYVRICDAFGEGFFFVPGTDTCLRVSGQVRAEYSVRGGAPTDNPAAYAYNQAGQVYRRDLTNFRARGYLNADSRTQTAYGTLRAFVSFRITQDTTGPGPSGGRGETGVAGVPAGTRVSTGAFQGLNPSTSYSSVDKGFIQFAGFTAGRAQSFFDFDAQSYELLSNTVANSNQITELFAYTATFGGGFSATFSAEDRTERAISDSGQFVFSSINGLPAGFANGTATNPTNGSINNPIVVTNAAGVVTNRLASVMAYAGETIPDLVGNLRYDASWGSAQLSGAYHNVRSAPVAILRGGGTVANPYVQGGTVTPSADGFAVLGGVKVLLPMLAKGDSLTLQGSYQQGAMDYVNPINYQPVGLSNVFGTLTNGVGQTFGVPVNDAFVLTNGRLGLSRAAGGYAAFRHYFVPQVYSSLYGDYLDIENPVQAQRLGTGTTSAEIYQIGFNTVYVPTKDFQIGGEVLYTNLLYKGLAATAANTRGNTTPADNDDIRGRLSFRRAF